MTTPTTETALAPPWRSQLDYLKLTYFAEHDEVLTQQAAEKRWPQLSYLERLVGGEHQRRQARASERRVHAVAFPQIKIVDDFHWSWPTLNEAKGRHLFRLGFIEQKTNVGFLGPTGTEKTPLACAIAYHACQRGHSGLFTTAVDIVNYLLEAQAAHRHLPSVICRPASDHVGKFSFEFVDVRPQRRNPVRRKGLSDKLKFLRPQIRRGKINLNPTSEC